MKFLWDKRYKNEGHLWGDAPSLTAEIVNRHLKKNSIVLDFGFGYGRDILYLAQKGHRVFGYELSAEGASKASELIKNASIEENVIISVGKFDTVPFAENSFDAIYSHRTLHLLNDRVLNSFQIQVNKILKPGGFVCISARDHRDFNPEQMHEVSPGVAVYKEHVRSDHKIKFWSEEMFRSYFSDDFTGFSYFRGSEVESISNPQSETFFTVMVAYKG